MGFSTCKYYIKGIAENLNMSEAEVKDILDRNTVGGYARIFKFEDRGNYGVGQVAISKKNKEDGTYKTDFQDGFVRFVGQAHNTMKNITIGDKGVPFVIKNCDVTNLYISPEGKTSYAPHYTIFEVLLKDDNNRATGNRNTSTVQNNRPVNDFVAVPDGIEEELPFN